MGTPVRHHGVASMTFCGRMGPCFLSLRKLEVEAKASDQCGGLYFEAVSHPSVSGIWIEVVLD